MLTMVLATLLQVTMPQMLHNSSAILPEQLDVLRHAFKASDDGQGFITLQAQPQFERPTLATAPILTLNDLNANRTPTVTRTVARASRSPYHHFLDPSIPTLTPPPTPNAIANPSVT